MGIHEDVKRSDAWLKVTGAAKYVEDLVPANALHVKLVHSTIANGVVKSVNIEKALEMPGVELIVTCFDVPDHMFATAGHPASLDEAHADIADKHILSKRVRFYGDDVAAVAADTPLHAMLAAEAIEVEYEEYEPLLTPEKAFDASQPPIHELRPNNELARLDFKIDGEGNTDFYTGSFSAGPEIAGRNDLIGTNYYTPPVQACHLENTGCFAYFEGRRAVITTCTQAPWAIRRNVADALQMPIGDVRVIKPFLGGGFGNKQDTTYEPLAVFMSKKLGGRPISIQLTREETFVNTRTRHAFDMNMTAKVNDEGILTSKATRINANGGAYAAHNHAVAGFAITTNFQTYETAGEQIGESSTMYTNLPPAAAMRGYGIPQIVFGMECQMEDMAFEHGWDPMDFRLKNIQRPGFVDPFDKFVEEANGFRECLERAREISEWDRRHSEYTEYNQNGGDIRKGIGMAVFSYKTGVWPLTLENAACRIIMNEDGTAQVQVGATELGQGSDTVFAQILSEVTTIPEHRISVVSFQDTDITPYDNGAYASRQTYVSGAAVKKAGILLNEKLIGYAAQISGKMRSEGWHIEHEAVVNESGEVILTIAEICRYMNFINDGTTDTEHICVEVTHTTKSNLFCYGVSVIDLEVDIKIGKIRINKAYCVHDSGQILNPQLAEAQVHGGAGMGIGYAVGEQLLFDEKGRMLNNNLLDYKFPTSMDLPDMEVEFVETYEPTGPFGNKGLAEPPLIPQAPAVRNAVLHATGVAFNSLPLNPEKLVSGFKKAGLI